MYPAQYPSLLLLLLYVRGPGPPHAACTRPDHLTVDELEQWNDTFNGQMDQRSVLYSGSKETHLAGKRARNLLKDTK